MVDLIAQEALTTPQGSMDQCGFLRLKRLQGFFFFFSWVGSYIHAPHVHSRTGEAFATVQCRIWTQRLPWQPPSSWGHPDTLGPKVGTGPHMDPTCSTPHLHIFLFHCILHFIRFFVRTLPAGRLVLPIRAWGQFLSWWVRQLVGVGAFFVDWTIPPLCEPLSQMILWFRLGCCV